MLSGESACPNNFFTINNILCTNGAKYNFKSVNNYITDSSFICEYSYKPQLLFTGIGLTSLQDLKEIRIISRNGGNVYLRDGHQYFCHKKNKKGTLILRCSKYHRGKCPGCITITEDLKEVLRSHTHTCKTDHAANEIALQIYKCKKLLASTNLPVTAVYSNVLEEAEFGVMPSFHSVKSGLYRARKKEKSNLL